MLLSGFHIALLMSRGATPPPHAVNAPKARKCCKLGYSLERSGNAGNVARVGICDLPSSDLLMLRLDNRVRHDSRCGADSERWRGGAVARVRGQLGLIENNNNLGCTRRQKEIGRSGGAVLREGEGSVVGW